MMGLCVRGEFSTVNFIQNSVNLKFWVKKNCVGNLAKKKTDMLRFFFYLFFFSNEMKSLVFVNLNRF